MYDLIKPYLSHHGIKGQQWGIQHGTPYPLDKNQSIRIKKGAVLNHVSTNKKINLDKRGVYAYDGSDSWDKTVYQGAYSEFLRYSRGGKIYDHTFTVKANLNVSANAADNSFKINSVDIDSKGPKDLNVKKLVVKAFPLISSKVEGDDLILTISNPSDSDEDITVAWFTVDWTGVSASINEKVIKTADLSQFVLVWESTAFTESIAPGNKIEFRVQAEQGSTVQVSSIILDTVNITSDYTNVGKWSSFKVTAKK